MNPLHAVIRRPACDGDCSRSISTIFKVEGAACLTNSGSLSRVNDEAVDDNASAIRLMPIFFGEHPETVSNSATAQQP